MLKSLTVNSKNVSLVDRENCIFFKSGANWCTNWWFKDSRSASSVTPVNSKGCFTFLRHDRVVSMLYSPLRRYFWVIVKVKKEIAKFVWTGQPQRANGKLKEEIMKLPVLTLLDDRQLSAVYKRQWVHAR